MINLYMIRHAESEGNVNLDIIGGRSNHLHLTLRGRKQALNLFARLIMERIKFDKIYCSPALRTIETAAISGNGCEEAFIDEDIQELDQGEWTGGKRSEIYTPATLELINRDNWNFKAPGGESQREVAERMMKKRDEITSLFSGNGKNYNLGMYTHGGAIKYLLAEMENSDRRIAWKRPIENTSITQLRYDGKWEIVRINDYSHLN